MFLFCTQAHEYQGQRFEPGQVYELDDGIGARLLQDYGPGGRSSKTGQGPRFQVAAVDAEPEPEEDDTEPVPARRVLSDLKLAELLELAAAHNVTIPEGAKKPDVARALREAKVTPDSEPATAQAGASA